MAKPNIWRDTIYEVLDNMSLNYSELFKKVKIELKEFNKSNRPERLFNEQLVDLLKEGRIRITGYDESVHKNKEGEQVKKIQAFKKEGIIFELIRTDKTEPIDIILLLNQLEQINDSKGQMKARLKLLNIFEKNFRQYENEEVSLWNRLESNVFSRTIDDELDGLERTIYKLKNSNTKKYLSYYDVLLKELMDRLHFYEIFKEDGRFGILHVWQIKSVNSEDKDRLFDIFGGLDYLNPSVYPGDKTSECFLESIGFAKPKIKTSEEVKAIFRRILLYSVDVCIINKTQIYLMKII